MRTLLTVLTLLVTACTTGALGSTTTTTTTVTVATAPPTTATPTTTRVTLPLQVEDCSTPPVTFSLLCQVYEKTQEWHVDRPIDPQRLASAALEGLNGFTTPDAEPPPRALICAIPDPAFNPLCQQLVTMVEDSSVPVGEAIEAAVLSMTEIGLDPFSYYVPPDQVGSFRANGLVGGVGILLDATNAVGSRCVRVTATCPLRILVVLENNPGVEAGLHTDDQIVAIDGDPVEGLSFADAATRIAGDETGEVELTIQRQGHTEVFGIHRSRLVVPTVEIDLPKPGVGYIRIPDFEADIPDLVRGALASLMADSPGTLVVDLRDNPGGLVDSAVSVASEFMDGGEVLETVDPEERIPYMASAGGLATDPSLVVLVNRGTASAAEILAAALEDRRGATIVGEPTYGKNAVQIAFDLRNGGEFHVAVAHWLSPDGSSVADGGLRPDRIVELPTGLAPDELIDLAIAETP